MITLSTGVLRWFVVPGRVLVLLTVHAVHAHHLRVYTGPATTEKHAGNTQDGQQTLQHSGQSLTCLRVATLAFDHHVIYT